MDITALPSWLLAEYDHHGWWKCRYCRSKYLPTHMEVGSAENAWSNFQPVHPWTYSHRHPWLFVIYDPHGKDCSYNPVAFPPSMEVRCGKCGKCMGSNFQPTTMDGGSADIASLHGCNLVGQRRSSCRGANICPSFPGHKKTPTWVGVFGPCLVMSLALS